MPNFTDLSGLISTASAMAATLLLFPRAKRLAKPHLAMLAASVFVAALIPFSGLPLAAYVRGATGDLSITTVVLLWCALLRPLSETAPGCTASDTGNRLALLALIGFAAVMLYPLALGWGTYDPYRIGYGNGQFVATLFLIALAAWLCKYYSVAICLALATLAWAIGWYESSNLWDYLLDPFVSVYALAALLKQAAKTLTKPLLNKPGKPPMLN